MATTSLANLQSHARLPLHQSLRDLNNNGISFKVDRRTGKFLWVQDSTKRKFGN